jgi:chromosome segregation ATPase
LADDQDVSPEEIAITLDNAGKSEDQLQSDVELLLQRREWSRQIQAADDAEAVMRKSQAEIDKLVRDRDAYAAKINAKIDQHRAAFNDAERRAHGVHSARESLSGSCYDPVVLSREAEVSARLSDLVQQDRELVHEIRKAERTVYSVEAELERHQDAYKAHYLPADRAATAVMIENSKAAARNYRGHLRRLRDEHSELRAEITRLQAEMHELADRRLVP